MTDVRNLHYKMADRTKGLGKGQMFLVVKELARIHAFSWGYKQLNKLKKITERFPFLTMEQSGEFSKLFQTLLAPNLQLAIDTVKNDVCSEVVVGLERLKSNIDLVLDVFYGSSVASKLGTILRIPVEAKFKNVRNSIDTESKEKYFFALVKTKTRCMKNVQHYI